VSEDCCLVVIMLLNLYRDHRGCMTTKKMLQLVRAWLKTEENCMVGSMVAQR
jgi:hypothetical protein